MITLQKLGLVFMSVIVFLSFSACKSGDFANTPDTAVNLPDAQVDATLDAGMNTREVNADGYSLRVPEEASVTVDGDHVVITFFEEAVDSLSDSLPPGEIIIDILPQNLTWMLDPSTLEDILLGNGGWVFGARPNLEQATLFAVHAEPSTTVTVATTDGSSISTAQRALVMAIIESISWEVSQ